MKKFINIFVFALCATLAFTACTDDSDYYDEPGEVSGAPVKVLSRETEFDAPASQGKIVVECDGPISVTSSDESNWVSTEVDGNVITVKVEENLSFEGRTCMLTISSGSYSTRLAVYQAGSYFEFIGPINLGVDDNKNSTDFILNTNLVADLKVEALMPQPGTTLEASAENGYKDLLPADFITITEIEGGFNATVAENTTGAIREGLIKYTYGTHSGTIPVKQYDFDKDVAGEYVFKYRTSLNGTTVYKKTANFIREGSSYYLEIPVYQNTNYKIPVEFDEGSMRMRIYSSGDCGLVPGTTNHVVTCIFGKNAANSVSIGWGAGYGIIADLSIGTFSDKSGEGYEFEFGDEKTWADRTEVGCAWELFTALPPTSGTRLSPSVRCLSAYYPVLQRVYTQQ